MSLLSCAHASEVRTAAVCGRWTDELRAHAASCRHCGDVALIASTLGGPSSVPTASVNPGVLWMRARFARRQRAEAQVSRLIMGAQIAMGSILAGAFVAIGRQMAWWRLPADTTMPASLVAVVGVLMLAAVAAANLISRES